MSAPLQEDPSPGNERSTRTGPGRFQDVVEAALTLFAERGYLGTSMKDIAGLLGLRAPSLYNHVDSKQELLREIMVRTMNELLNSHRAVIATSADVVEQLRRAMETHVIYHANNPRDVRIGNAEIQNLEEPVHGEILRMRDEYSASWQSIIERGVREGRFDSPSPRLSSFAMLEMGIGVSMWFRPGGPLTVAQLGYYYGDMALRLVNAAPAAVGRAGAAMAGVVIPAQVDVHRS
ncbi:TetR/AcrR family transcriptional regulator [Nakamurella leprariae]|uniref:TetR family transcriptional regulator n=1 Tax=Nakamurella leprariae TaxID=2803911 RepID=A0A939BZN1_9ACTN|nr:TetR/AcrR family transcriptional regulator [Nakamurella leprariae]MBM9468340.1 TetR family transcriptional regulator [Nakamurella leprariae]